MKNCTVKKRKAYAFILLLTLIFVAVSVLLGVLNYKPFAKIVVSEWSSENAFNLDYAKSIQKNKNESFTILNFSDIQMGDVRDLFERERMRKTLKALVEKFKPNLITLTGDQVWTVHTKYSLRLLVGWLDELGVPFAPILGNHDSEGTASYDYISELYEGAKNSLYSRGESNLGYGNYVINIIEDGKIYKSLIMFDTHSVRSSASGFRTGITDTQVEWYKWVTSGLKQQNGGATPQSFCFMHIPLPEYEKAYDNWKESGFSSEMGVGEKHEQISVGSLRSELFSEIKKNNTTHVFCGHDHKINTSINYQGVYLNFCQKTGNLSYCHKYNNGNWMKGATVITLSGENDVLINNYLG